jgi:hypothetical protein
MTNIRERIRKMLRNEKGNGGLLLIVIFFFVFIAIFSAPLFSMTVNRQSYDSQIINEKRANMVAVGGMEAFIKYLNSKPIGTSRQSYFSSYPGWGQKTILLPEGDKIIYNLTNSRSNDPTKYIVTMTATAGINKTVTKSLKYVITVNDNAPIIDATATPTPVPSGTNTIYTSGTVNGKIPAGVTVVYNPAIKPAISDYINTLSSSINNQINTYASQALQCPNDTELMNMINNSTNNPVIIKVDTLNGGTYNFGSTSKQVVLLVDSLNADNNVTINMPNGTLIVLNNIKADNSFNFNGKNLWFKGSASLPNNPTITVEETLYAASLSTDNNATLSATNITIHDALNAPNNLSLSTSKGIACGSISADNNPVINCTNDLLVRDNLSAKNNITLTTGGNIAVGGDVDVKNNLNITNPKGGQTILNVNGSTTGGGGGNGTPWNPTRQ